MTQENETRRDAFMRDFYQLLDKHGATIGTDVCRELWACFIDTTDVIWFGTGEVNCATISGYAPKEDEP